MDAIIISSLDLLLNLSETQFPHSFLQETFAKTLS